MRHSLLFSDPEICNIPSLIHQMEKDNQLKIVEDRIYDNYYSGLPGQIFVFRKPDIDMHVE